MVLNDRFVGMPPNFKDEEKELLELGITSWQALKSLKQAEIIKLVKTGRSTERNLIKIKGLAELVCELKIEPSQAALLLHSGIPTVSALATSTPEEIVKKAGRFERQLLRRHQTLIDLNAANSLINRAKALMSKN